MACEASVFVSEQSLGARQELLTLRPEIGARAKIDGSGDGEAGACPIAPPPASLIFSRDQTLLCYGALTTAGRGFFHFLALTKSFASRVRSRSSFWQCYAFICVFSFSRDYF